MEAAGVRSRASALTRQYARARTVGAITAVDPRSGANLGRPHLAPRGAPRVRRLAIVGGQGGVEGFVGGETVAGESAHEGGAVRLRPIASLSIPRRFLRGTYSRSILAIIALVCGVALVCAMDLVNRAVMTAFTEVVDTMAGRTALTIGAGGAPFPEAIIERVADVPGVELAVPVVSSTAFTVDGSGELLTVHGV